MPIISIFFGIVIRMNFEDHNPPHFHAEYQGREAVFDIRTGRLIAGELPKHALNIVSGWAKKNRRALLENWKRAKHLQPLTRIPGADQW